MADNTGLSFVIDGREYPAPGLDTFDMAERRIMFELAGIVEEDFVREEDEGEDEYDTRVRKLTRHPGFMETLMHVAYARGNPDVKRARVQSLIEKTNYHEAIQKWGEQVDAEDDASPPVSGSTSERSNSSPTGSAGLSESSGSGSANGSGQPDSIPASTGTTPSDTPSTSPRSLSAV